MRRRLLPYAANSLVVALLVLVILAAANFLAYRNSGRLDLTREKLHSVSGQTLRVLGELDEEVEVLAFLKEIGLERKEFQKLIGLYKRGSPKIKVRYIDPDQEPGLARQYEIAEYGTVVLLGGGKEIKIKLADPLTGGILETSEQEITNALIKLSRDIQKKVYFLTGHGERDIGDLQAPTALGRARKALEDESYLTEEFVLIRRGEVPPENSLLVVAAPKKSLLLREVDAVRKFLDGGGAALFLLEPNSGAELVGLLRGYGIEFNDDVVIDPSSKLVGGGDIAPIVATYPISDITENFRFATIFPFSRSVGVNTIDGYNTQIIAKTSEYSWAERDLEQFSHGTAELGPEDVQGPLGVAAIAEGREGAKEVRIAGFGSVDMVSNRFFDFSGNSDLFLNTVNWLTRDENLISIRPRVAREGKLNLTPHDLRILFAVGVVAVPLVVLVSGVAVWIKRRNR